MLSSVFPLLYGLAVTALLWQAFRVMSNGLYSTKDRKIEANNQPKPKEDRTGRLTIHPELLDQEGRITNEELLTVRFSEDNDQPYSTETSAE